MAEAPIPRSPAQPAATLLALKIVRPPQLAEGAQLLKVPGRHRRGVTRPQPFVTLVSPGGAVAPSSSPSLPPAARPPPPPGRPATAEHKAGSPEMAMHRNAVRIQTARSGASAVDAKDLYQAQIEAWPGRASSQLVEAVGKVLVEADRQENAILRADRVVEALRLMTEQMPRFAPVFVALSRETQILVSAVAASSAATDAVRRDIDTMKAQCEATLSNQQVAFREEREAWFASRDSRDEQLDNLNRDLGVSHRRLAELTIELEATRRANEEAFMAKRNFETMATQFAERNKSLTDKIADLERQLEAAIKRSDAATAANYKYAQRVLTLEEHHAGESNSHQQAMAKIADALQAMTGKYRTAQSSAQALRDQTKQLEAEAMNLRSELEDMARRQEDLTRSLTPRPEFDQRDVPLFGGLTSTANRFSAISDAIRLIKQRESDRLSEHTMLLNAAHLGRASKDSLRLVSTKVPPTVLAPIANTVNSRVAPWLVTNLPAVKTSQQLLREFVPVVRQHYLDMAALDRELGPSGNRSVPFIELHCSVLYHFQAAITQPGPCAEACYGMYYTACAWASVPLVRVFLCSLREECGPWVYAAQNAFVTRVMRALAKCSGATMADYRSIVAVTLRGEGFGDAATACAIAQFMEIYVAASATSEALPTVGTFTSPRSALHHTASTVSPRAVVTLQNAASSVRFQRAATTGVVARVHQQPVGAMQSPSTSSSITPGGGAALKSTSWGEVSMIGLPEALEKSVNNSDASSSDGGGNDDEAEATLKVEFEESRHGPANMVTITELPFINVLRRVHLERLLTFYAALDSELLARCKAATSVAKTNAAALNALVSLPLLVSAFSAVQPLLSHGEASTWAHSVFTLCTAQLAVEKAFMKANKTENAAMSYFISNRSLPLSGLNRWYHPSVAGPPFPRPRALTTSASAPADGASNSLRGGAGAKMRSSSMAASTLASKSSVSVDVLANVRKELLLAPVPGVGSASDSAALSTNTASMGASNIGLTVQIAPEDDSNDDLGSSSSSNDDDNANASDPSAVLQSGGSVGNRLSVKTLQSTATPRRKSAVASSPAGGLRSVGGASLAASTSEGSPLNASRRAAASAVAAASVVTFPLHVVMRMARKVEYTPQGIDL